ncbi:MAG: thioesterase family protein [Hyphomonadaceae bacterium]|nr:thioesterase family protein [Hyphomonadaceae bacterium]
MSRKTTDAPLPLELYRGSVNTWECDENFHMNVRFFASRAMEGLAHLAAAMGAPGAFKERATATLVPLDMHVRFLKEARHGAPLSMRGGLVSISEDEAVVYQELMHGDGTPAAAFTTRVAHMEPLEERRFAWSQRTRERAQSLMCAPPAHGTPRSIDMAVTPGDPTIAFADKISAPVVGRLAVTSDQCDAFGRMRMELFLGRVSDAVPNLLAGWRTEMAKAAAEADGVEKTAGGAVLEYRIAPRRWPRVGDLLEVRSGVAEVGEKTNRIIHWLFDPVTGHAWCTAEAVAVTFDLATRKTIAIPEAQRKAMQARIVKGMTI